ncbi:Hypothetical protein PBC10988_28060 [Planctomycetales bacterium 10988]|nr:Hypothetical protein PBC10988_28060 [Planctomycetales bacterium 10988]
MNPEYPRKRNEPLRPIRPGQGPQPQQPARPGQPSPEGGSLYPPQSPTPRQPGRSAGRPARPGQGYPPAPNQPGQSFPAGYADDALSNTPSSIPQGGSSVWQAPTERPLPSRGRTSGEWLLLACGIGLTCFIFLTIGMMTASRFSSEEDSNGAVANNALNLDTSADKENSSEDTPEQTTESEDGSANGSESRSPTRPPVPKVNLRWSAVSSHKAKYTTATFTNSVMQDEQTVWIYLPEGADQAKSLPCVFVAPAGTPLIHGIELSEGDQPEHWPYVEAGFAVVAYDLSGKVPTAFQSKLTGRWLDNSFRIFHRSQAGLLNAQQAIDFALENVPEIDPEMLYAAGHSSAGTLALQLSQREPRIRGCVAYAPCVDIKKHLSQGDSSFGQQFVQRSDVAKFLENYNPWNNLGRTQCPTFLFAAKDDSVVSVDGISDYFKALKEEGKKTELTTINSGGHYDSMIEEGIPRGIEFLSRLVESQGGPDLTPSAVTREIIVFSDSPQKTISKTLDTSGTKDAIRADLDSFLPEDSPFKKWDTPVYQHTINHSQSTFFNNTTVNKEVNSIAKNALPGYWEIQPQEPAEASEPLSKSVDGKMELPLGAADRLIYPEDESSSFVGLISLGEKQLSCRVWNLETNSQTGAISISDPIDPKTLQLSADGERLAARPVKSLDEDQKSEIYLYSIISSGRETIWTVAEEPRSLRAFRFWNNESLSVTSRLDGQLMLWNRMSQQEPTTIPLNEYYADATAVSHDRRHLALWADQGLIDFYDAQEQKEVGRIQAPNLSFESGYICEQLIYSPDDRWLAGFFTSFSGLKVLSCWDMNDGSQVMHVILEEMFKSKPPTHYRGAHLQWMPRSQGWLVDGKIFVYLDAEQIKNPRKIVSAMLLPFTPFPDNMDFQRRFRGEDQLLVAVGSEANRRLAPYPLLPIFFHAK